MSASVDAPGGSAQPAETAMDRWYEAKKRHGGGLAYDHPKVSVWFPQSLPFARLQVHEHGCSEPSTLPRGQVLAYLDLAGVSIGGPLDDLELLIAAATEEIVRIRQQATEMQAEGRVDG